MQLWKGSEAVKKCLLWKILLWKKWLFWEFSHSEKVAFLKTILLIFWKNCKLLSQEVASIQKSNKPASCLQKNIYGNNNIHVPINISAQIKKDIYKKSKQNFVLFIALLRVYKQLYCKGLVVKSCTKTKQMCRNCLTGKSMRIKQL